MILTFDIKLNKNIRSSGLNKGAAAFYHKTPNFEHTKFKNNN